MTKKSKKKSIKTGQRSYETSGSTTVCFDSVKDGQFPVLKYHESPAKTKQRQSKYGHLNNNCATENEDNAKNFKTYPSDLWFLISLFITPNEVSKFARINKQCLRITQTAGFWLRFYKIYIVKPKALPICLQPLLINVKPGLQARVVRSLYHGCDQFKTRIPLQMANIERIEKRLCRNVWWEKEPLKKTNEFIWKYHFKLTRIVNKNHRQSTRNVTSNVGHNTEIECCLLVILSKYFIQFNSPTGLILTSLSAGASSSDMRLHKIKMRFHKYRQDGKYHSHDAVYVILDPVIDFLGYDWWHPQYPHPVDHF